MDRLRNHRNYHSPHSLSESVNTASQITECIVGDRPTGQKWVRNVQSPPCRLTAQDLKKPRTFRAESKHSRLLLFITRRAVPR